MSATLRIVTPSRLHFGLLAWGPEAPRQFGSLGLMIDRPGLTIEARPADRWSAEGALSARALAVARLAIERLQGEGVDPRPLHFAIEAAPPEHVGLGTGTQLSLAVAQLILRANGGQAADLERLVALTDRGLRSGIGVHGFMRGGFLVDGGRTERSAFPPLLAHQPFPADWAVLVVVPPRSTGLTGVREREAFARLPGVPLRTIERLCRLVLLGVLPAVAERDLALFGTALEEVQREVGLCFAPAQGGMFATPELESLAAIMRSLGLLGVGQSSWGPALYGFMAANPHAQEWIAKTLVSRTDLAPDAILWTHGASVGARLQTFE